MVVVLLLAVGPLLAADVSGKWKFTVDHDLGGKKSEPKLELAQKRTRVTGSYDGPFGKLPVTGDIKGDEFTLVIRPPRDGTTVQFRGKVEGGKLSGNVLFSGDFASKFSAVKQ